MDACHLEHNKPRHAHALQAVALACHNAGHDIVDFRRVAEQLALAALQQDHNAASNLHRLLERTWSKAEARAAASPAVPDRYAMQRTLQEAQQAADRAPWSGHAGNGDRAALAGIHRIAEADQSLLLVLNVRRVSEASGLSKSTAARALHRLTDAGWLAKVEAAKDDRAARYRLTIPDRYSTGTPLHPVGGEPLSQLGTHPLDALLTLDAFAPAALGRSAARVLAFLDPLEWQTPAALAHRLGLTVRSVRRALVLLEAHGIAYRQRQGRGYVWVARLEALEVDRIAAEYGTAGRAAARAAEHERERAGFTEYLLARPYTHRHLSRSASIARAVAKVEAATAARAVA